VVVQAAMESGMSQTELFSFEKNRGLCQRNELVLKMKEKGLIENVEDDSVRRATYSALANLCFPHLYPNGESSLLDF